MDTHIRKDITELATERVVIEVSNMERGAKKITIRSDEVIYNDSDKPIEIVIAGKAGGAVNVTLSPKHKQVSSISIIVIVIIISRDLLLDRIYSFSFHNPPLSSFPVFIHSLGYPTRLCKCA